MRNVEVDEQRARLRELRENLQKAWTSGASWHVVAGWELEILHLKRLIRAKGYELRASTDSSSSRSD